MTKRKPDMLYVIEHEYFLAGFLTDALDGEPGVEVVCPQPIRRGKLWKLRRAAEAYLAPRCRKTAFYAKEYIGRLSAIEPSDSVVFFGEQNLKELLILGKFIRAGKKSVWIWNPLDNSRKTHRRRMKFAARLRKAGYGVYTFDQSDAAECGFTHAPQVFRNVDRFIDRGISPDIDLFFVGQDKKRLTQLLAIKAAAAEQGLTDYFHILPDKHGTYSVEERGHLSEQGIEYCDTMKYINRSRCLVEILQKGQSGMSVRALEALFFDRKLVTNNRAMAQADFYHPDNIFITGVDDISRLAEFIARPYRPVSPEIKREYDIRYWIRRFE